MNTKTTVDKMNGMRLLGMSSLYQQQLSSPSEELTIDEAIAMLIDTEWEWRHNRKIQSLMTSAGFKTGASAMDIDYASHRKLNKNNFQRLLTLEFLHQKENIIITGSTGVGKSYLAQALGVAACQMTIPVLYCNFATLGQWIKLAHLDGSYFKLLKKIAKAKLLIIDDFGLQSFDTQTRQALMDIIEDRYERASTIITAQIPVQQWHQTIGEGTIADAILDRLVYSSHRIELEGESLRKNKMLKG
jgi:DNA replication protein DnaC